MPRTITLRHPDVSVIVELAAAPHAEKIGYIRGLLPALAAIRRRTGLPHRLVLDEAHYFLDHPEVDVAFDLELAPRRRSCARTVSFRNSSTHRTRLATAPIANTSKRSIGTV